MGAHELGCQAGKWNALVRRARLTDRQKLAALTVGSYADSDGGGIHVGAARFGVDMGVSYRTARRYLAWLREVGLIELVRAGNRRRGWSDEYRLILGPDVLEHLEVPDPDKYEAMIEDLKLAKNGTARKPDQGSAKVTPDKSGPAEASGVSPTCPPINPIRGQTGVDQGSAIGDPPPPITTSQERSTSQKTSGGDLRTEVAVEGDPEPEPEIARVVELRPGITQEAPYVRPPRPQSFAQQNLAAAAARRRAAVAAYRAQQEAK